MLLILSYAALSFGMIGIFIWAFYGWEDFNDKHDHYEALYFAGSLSLFGLSAVFYGVDNYITYGAVSGNIASFFSTYVIIGCGGLLSLLAILIIWVFIIEYLHTKPIFR